MGKRLAVLSVASSSSPGTTYRVWVGREGPEFCDCPAHKFHQGKPAGQRPDCKHMRALRNNVEAMQAAWEILDSPSGMVSKPTPTFQRDPRPAAPKKDRGFRFIEIQEQDEEGVVVSVTDLSRFNNLEV